MAKHTEQQISDLHDAFRAFDKNDDGVINYLEVKDMLISLGEDAREWRVKEIINDVDLDGDGSINFAEFLNLMAKNSAVQEECGSELEQMFRIFDRDGDGYITHAEMKRALEEQDGKVPDSEIAQMINEADQDGDGKVTFPEFEAIMKAKHGDVFK